MNIRDIIKDRILVLDGAMGTMIQSYGLTEEVSASLIPTYR